MLSRVAFRSGVFGSALFRAPVIQSNAVAVRCASGGSIEKHIENWDKANKIYYGPERDTANFPITKQPDTSPPTRMGLLPASWFTFFYEKTGVTGPYVFGAGLTTFLLSKELWVIEHGFTEFIGFWIACAILIRKVGPGMAKALDKIGTDYRAKHWDQPVEAVKSQAQEVVTAGEHAIWQQDGQKEMFAAKRENVDLQLESVYRQRLAQVHRAVKQRLDYQLHKETTQRQFEQTHMVNWIVDSVVKGITPQQEKDSITKCIADLKALSAKA